MAAAFVEVIVSGRVQGVGYREFARRAAERRGVAGFVRNRLDGTVEARVVGDIAAIEAMLDDLRRGPPGARVDSVNVRARGEAAPEPRFTIEASV